MKFSCQFLVIFLLFINIDSVLAQSGSGDKITCIGKKGGVPDIELDLRSVNYIDIQLFAETIANIPSETYKDDVVIEFDGKERFNFEWKNFRFKNASEFSAKLLKNGKLIDGVNGRHWQCNLGREDVLAVLSKPPQVIENASDLKKEKSKKQNRLSVSDHASSGLAKIIVFRDQNVIGHAIRPVVRVNGRQAGRCKPDRKFILFVPPGTYQISSETENADFANITLKEGQTAYVRCEIKIGIVAGRVFLTQVENTFAKPLVSKLFLDKEYSFSGSGLVVKHEYLEVEDTDKVQKTMASTDKITCMGKKGGVPDIELDLRSVNYIDIQLFAETIANIPSETYKDDVVIEFDGKERFNFEWKNFRFKNASEFSAKLLKNGKLIDGVNGRHWQCNLGREDVLAVLSKPPQVIENASDLKKEKSTIERPVEVSSSKLNEQKVPDLGTDIDKAKEECSLIGFTAGTEKYGDCVMKLLGN